MYIYIYYNGGRPDRISKNFNYTLKIIMIKYPFSEYYRSRKDKYIKMEILCSKYLIARLGKDKYFDMNYVGRWSSDNC